MQGLTKNKIWLLVLFSIFVISFIFQEKNLVAQTPAPVNPTILRGLESGEIKICGREINLGGHLERVNLHLKEFLPILTDLEKSFEAILLSGKKISNLAKNCLRENCGASCGCRNVAVTKFNYCETVSLICECEVKGNVTICKAGGYKIRKDLNIECRDKGKVVKKRIELQVPEVACFPNQQGDLIKIEKVCTGIQDVPECGRECCTEQGTVYNPPDISEGGVQQLGCQKVDSCKAQPQQCQGIGEGPLGTAPCPEGINKNYQNVKDLIENIPDILKELEQLQFSIYKLEREKRDLARTFRTWYSQRDKKDLFDCITMRSLEKYLVKYPVECPYGGLTYFECER